MKIGIVSDIHGNSVALEAVLREAEVQGIEHLFILGDLVGYYYHPDTVLKQLKKWPHDMIQGNHERMLGAARKSKHSARKIKEKYGSGIEMALRKIKEKDIQELLDLPKNKRVIIDGVRFALFHGAPWDENAYIYPDTEKEIMDKAASEDVDFVFLGHSHHPFIYKKGNTVVANVGSVGQARDEGGAACWGIVDTTNKKLTLKRTKFSASSIIDEVKKIDPGIPYLHEIFSRRIVK